MEHLFMVQKPSTDGKLHIAQIAFYAELIKAMENITRSNYYIIDYKVEGFAYIPDNSPILCDFKKEEVLQIGWKHYCNILRAEEFEKLQTINKIAIEYFQNIPLEKRTQYSIEYAMNIVNRAGANRKIRHCQTPITLDSDGDIWLSLCSISNPIGTGDLNILVKNNKMWCEYLFNAQTKKFEKQKPAELSTKEKEIIQMLATGLTEHQIGELLFISANTVKYYKKNILKKMNAINIQRAIVKYLRT